MSWLTSLFLDDEDRANIDAGNAATEKLRILNAKKNAENPAVYTDDWMAETEKNMADDPITDADAQVTGAFWEGWNEGAESIRNGVGGAINTATGSLFKIVPWQVWLIALAFGAWKIGLFKGLLKKSA